MEWMKGRSRRMDIRPAEEGPGDEEPKFGDGERKRWMGELDEETMGGWVREWVGCGERAGRE